MFIHMYYIISVIIIHNIRETKSCAVMCSFYPLLHRETQFVRKNFDAKNNGIYIQYINI